MAPPATKRRKLEHDDSDNSEASFEDDELNSGAASNESLAQDEFDAIDVSDNSDVSMTELEGADNEDISSDGGEEIEYGGNPVKEAYKQVAASQPATSKAHQKRDAQLQDGVYTAETFKSNVFKLQVDELLEQVKPKYGKKEAPAENAMRFLKSLIERLPSRAPMLISEAEKALESAGVTIPFPSPQPPKDAKYKLSYERPSNVNATGSYPLKTAARSDDELAIDLVVTMPKSTFQEKDHLNYRYFYKRAYFLACLAAGIKESKEHSIKLSFDCLGGNQLQPILVVQSSGDGGPADFSGSRCRINILPALPGGTFPITKLSPRSNCIRPKTDGDNDTTSKSLTPTPFYNSTLQSDAAITSYLKLLHATSGKCDAFKDACILGRIWLRQRGFASRLRKGGFGNFEWAAVMAILLQSNPGTGTSSLSPGYSSYQLFKATLQFLARHDLSRHPFKFQAQDVAFPKSTLAPSFFDGPRGLNILFKMTPWSYARLRSEARISIDMLGDTLFDQFDATFILKTDLTKLRYDSSLRIPLKALQLGLKSDGQDGRLEEICHKIYVALTRALTDRVTDISFSIPDTSAWPISSSIKREKQDNCILINLATDPANAHRTIDHGPAAENKQDAASFRKFWGDKSELRRFKDGSILESVVWSKDTSTPVLEQIVRYILVRHVGTEVADAAKFSSDSFAHLVPSGRIQGSSGVMAFAPIMNAFSAVDNDIRTLEGLPLQVRHIRAADAQLRYASVEPLQDTPASIVLQFEASARWPDDLCAIQRTKIAFLLKLSELLSAVHTSYVARIGLENPSQPSQNQAYLDITHRSGFSFRLRVHHDREATLLERQLKDKALDAQSRESAATALGLYKRSFIQELVHTQAIQNICTRFPALSPAIRLTKRWFDSHLLSPHFTPELVELLVVRTFLQPYPWPTPSCATTAFLRTLAWISRWDWRHVPLIVDFSSTTDASPADVEAHTTSGRMRSEDVEKIQTRFEAWRRIDPAMNRVVLFAATNLDTDGNTWTDRAKPEKVVAARMTALAKAATSAVRMDEDALLAEMNGQQQDSSHPFTPESLFVTNIQDFDIVIHIAPKYMKTNAKKHQQQRYKNIEVQLSTKTSQHSMTELAQLFAKDLQNVYGDAILWFYDTESLDRVAGLWNPAVTAQRAFKVKAGWSSVPVKNKGVNGKKREEDEKAVDIQVNKAAIYAEIRRLGGDLVSRIELNR